jgi:protein-tyrosine phosphatase
MPIELHWLNGPWPGKLALAARPRGGDWLEDEVGAWKRAGVDAVLSLLTKSEEEDLDLSHESAEVTRGGIEFISFPIPDLQIPRSEAKFAHVLEKLNVRLSSGKNVLVHCRQGIGRTGLVAACLLVSKGLSPETAAMKASAARGTPVPETPEQRDWVDHYASVLAGTK